MKKVKLIKIFIASPSDVLTQRDEVEKIIYEWNNQHTDSLDVVLLPIRWEKNSVASYRINESGQAVINKELVLSSDLLIAIFGNRMGTRTSTGKSGTVEEINIFHEEKNSDVGIFFIDNNDVPHELMKDRKYVDMYREYLSKEDKGLYLPYSTENIQRFITINVHKLLETKFSSQSIKSSSDNKISIFSDLEFDRDEQLFFIFSVEEELDRFGLSWMAEETLSMIRKWENKNNITGYLSSRYEITLGKLSSKDIIKTTEYTSHGNPRLYAYADQNYKTIKKVVTRNKDIADQIKSDFSRPDDDLPF